MYLSKYAKASFQERFEECVKALNWKAVMNLTTPVEWVKFITNDMPREVVTHMMENNQTNLDELKNHIIADDIDPSIISMDFYTAPDVAKGLLKNHQLWHPHVDAKMFKEYIMHYGYSPCNDHKCKQHLEHVSDIYTDLIDINFDDQWLVKMIAKCIDVGGLVLVIKKGRYDLFVQLNKYITIKFMIEHEIRVLDAIINYSRHNMLAILSRQLPLAQMTLACDIGNRGIIIEIASRPRGYFTDDHLMTLCRTSSTRAIALAMSTRPLSIQKRRNLLLERSRYTSAGLDKLFPDIEVSVTTGDQLLKEDQITPLTNLIIAGKVENLITLVADHQHVPKLYNLGVIKHDHMHAMVTDDWISIIDKFDKCCQLSCALRTNVIHEHLNTKFGKVDINELYRAMRIMTNSAYVCNVPLDASLVPLTPHAVRMIFTYHSDPINEVIRLNIPIDILDAGVPLTCRTMLSSMPHTLAGAHFSDTITLNNIIYERIKTCAEYRAIALPKLSNMDDLNEEICRTNDLDMLSLIPMDSDAAYAMILTATKYKAIDIIKYSSRKL